MAGVKDEDVPAAISRDGYQTRTAPGGGLLVKGGTMKGWQRMTLEEARRQFRIEAYTLEREKTATVMAPPPEPKAARVAARSARTETP